MYENDYYTWVSACRGGGTRRLYRRALSKVLYSNVIAHLLRNLEFVVKRSRTNCAMTGFNVQSLVRDIAPHTPWGDGVRRTGEGVAGCQEVLRSREQYIENQPSPQPSPIGEGVSNSHPELVSGFHKKLKHRGQSSVYKMLEQVQQDINLLKRTYSLINLFSYSPRKRCAFTLAEVLITLGIIGIVAAMTMPTLIVNHQKQVTISRLKKIYSVLSQQILLANSAGVPANEYLTAGDKVSADTTEAYFQTYWLPYFKGASIIKGRQYGESCQFKYQNGNCLPNNIYTDYSFGRVVFSTNDGYILYINVMGWSGSGDNLGDALFSKSQRVIIDINGLKGPNIMGKDIFRVTMNYDKNNVMPNYIEQDMDTINKNCSKTGTGESCFAKIIKDGWKISDDYPW